MSSTNFTIIHNSILDLELSMEALGLYVQMKRHITKKGWKIKREYCKAISGMGETAFRRVWKELQEKGVLVSECKRIKGKFEYEFTLICPISCNEKVKVNSGVPKNYETVKKKGSTDVVQASAKESILTEELTLEERLVHETGASVERVEKAIEYAVSKNAKNVLAYAKNTIDKNWDAKNNMEIKKVLNFCNYRQREYDLDELERKLLGWD